MPETEEEVWNTQVINAAYDFALRCAEIYSTNPHRVPRLKRVMNDLMTELWDRGFSQTEIRAAFTDALSAMDRYAAGEEQNGDGTGLGLYGTGSSRGNS